MKNSWENTTGDRVDYVQILADQVVVGSHAGSGHTDNAGRATFAEFLGGRFQDVVSAAHGPEVLEEVIEAVRRRAGSP